MRGIDHPELPAPEDNADLRKLILIVDDEIDITDTFSMLLELYGYRAITASSGPEALDILNHYHFDLIISDCMMPSMDGVEFCRRVRERANCATTPFVLMSGAPEQHVLTAPGYDVFLKKPFLFDVLLDIVHSILVEHPRPTL